MTESPTRRIKGIIVTGNAIAMFVRNGLRTILIDSPIPKTAVFTSAYYEPKMSAFVILLTDDSFDEVPEGVEFPIIQESVSCTELHPSNEITEARTPE